jgi:hypothetical protein
MTDLEERLRDMDAATTYYRTARRRHHWLYKELTEDEANALTEISVALSFLSGDVLALHRSRQSKVTG